MKKVPTYINIVSFWVLQIPVAYLLAKYLKMGTMGVYLWPLLFRRAFWPLLFKKKVRGNK
jgi:Na+-driven multidrug efflux pump